MPIAVTDPNRKDDARLGAGFAVLIDNEVHGWFTECSGLTVEREVKAHPEGGVNHFVHQLPGRIKRTNITLKHGLAGSELWDWFKAGERDGQVKLKNVSIVVYDSMLVEVNRWDLTDVYPIKWQGAGINSAGNDVVVETIEFASLGGQNGTSGLVQRQTDEQRSDQTASATGNQDIDLVALTKKVYALFQKELRVERDRLGYR